MNVNWRYWLPQFAMLAVTCVGVIVGGLVNATLGFVIIAGAAGFDLGFSFAHQFGTGSEA